MPSNSGGIVINPGERTVVVDMTTVGTNSRLVVYSDAACLNSVSLPNTITVPTTYYVASPVTANVSMKVDGNEIATSLATPLVWDFKPGVLAGIGIDGLVAEIIKFNFAAVSVVHGASASVARPTWATSIVIWIGSVEPTNAINNDVWVSTA